MNVHYMARSYFLPGILGSLNAKLEIDKRILIFLDGLNHKSNVIKQFLL